MSKQCSPEILSCIGNRDREPRNIIELALPVYHGLGGMLGVFGLPEWASSSGTNNLPLGNSHHLFFSLDGPLPLWLVGFRLRCILETPALAQAAPPT